MTKKDVRAILAMMREIERWNDDCGLSEHHLPFGEEVELRSGTYTKHVAYGGNYDTSYHPPMLRFISQNVTELMSDVEDFLFRDDFRRMLVHNRKLAFIADNGYTYDDLDGDELTVLLKLRFGDQ